jgi:ribosomal protein L36
MEYTIAAHNITEVHKKLAVFNKRANKNGLPEIGMTIISRYFEKRIDRYGNKFLQRMAVIDIDMPEAPYIKGWEFAAKIDEISRGLNHVYIHESFEGAVSFEDLKTRELYCDHCNTNRRRKKVFVIYNRETEEFKQVGKSCLAEFIAIDEEGVVNKLWSYFKTLDGYFDGISGWGTARPEIYASGELFMAAVVASVRTQGDYVGRSYLSGIPTCDDAWNHCLFPTKEDVERGYTFEYTAEDLALAQDVIAWLKENQGTLEAGKYGRFVRQASTYLLDLGAVRYKGIAYCATIYKSYMVAKDMEKQKPDSDAPESQYVAYPKDRLRGVKVSCTFITTRGTCSYTGDMKYLYKFMVLEGEYEGSIITWFTTGDKNIEEADELVVDFTIKLHKEFNEIKETHIKNLRIK